MTDYVSNISRRDPVKVADKALKAAAQFWFLVAVIGQWIFVYYVTVFYGGSALVGDLEAWSKAGPQGIIPGDTLGNLALAMHVLLAAIVMFGGPLQLIPAVRARFPTFHRWNGRIYIPAVFIASISGLYMILTRGSAGAPVMHIGTSLGGILIIVFGILAVRYAVARDIKTHRRWALRLFMVVNAVWFFRVGLMAWIMINQGPVGMDMKTFTGPFLTFWAYGQYLLPLAVLELYLRVQGKSAAIAKAAVAGLIFVMTIIMGVGVFAATMNMWLPKL